jgi:hypothetical protein
VALNISQQYDFIDSRWVKWDEEGKIELQIAPLSTKGYQDAMAAHHRWAQAQQSGFRRGVRDREIEDARTEAMRRGLADHIILSWRGVADEASGEAVPYTPAEGYRLLSDPENGDIFMVDVVAAASDTDSFRKKRIEAAAEKSEVPSGSGAESGSTTKRRGSSS